MNYGKSGKMNKGGNRVMSLSSPQAPFLAGSPHVPPCAHNTTMKGSAPRSAPISSPQAPFTNVSKRR